MKFTGKVKEVEREKLMVLGGDEFVGKVNLVGFDRPIPILEERLHALAEKLGVPDIIGLEARVSYRKCLGQEDLVCFTRFVVDGYGVYPIPPCVTSYRES